MADIDIAIERIRSSIPVFGAQCLKILDKNGDTQPLLLNRAQQHVHDRLEEQLRTTGKVRALILKGRQQGVSTYIAARFYNKTSLNFGKRAFIVAHEQKATDNLFGMVKRYHDHNPFAPSTGATNAKELIFDRLDGGYKLATAGSKDVGRSNTAQLLHGSEVGFWQNAAEHMAGIGNSVGDGDGTEIVLESTANGIGNKFHELWQKAEAGEGEYIAIFVPWFWQEEYRSTVPEGFELTEQDVQYRDAYGLDMKQMAWRRNKISLYGHGFEWLFDQEFPATASLAFRSSTSDPYISPLLTSAGINSGYRDDFGPLIVGVDPAHTGPDRTAIVFRRGRMVTRIETHQGLNTMAVTGLIGQIIQEHKPDAVMIDKGGIGAGIYDRLVELGHGNVYGVLSGSAAHDSRVYANKRAEMWARMKKWLEDAPVRLPRSPELEADMSAPGYRFDSSNRILIEKKEDMKKRGMRSPDIADALAHTFAEYIPVTTEGINRGGNAGHVPATNAGY